MTIDHCGIGPFERRANCIVNRPEDVIHDLNRRLQIAEARVAILEDALRRCATVKQVYYGHSTGGNPHDFVPDVESCTPEEIANHREAIRKWDAQVAAGEAPTAETHGLRWQGDEEPALDCHPWGIGTITSDEGSKAQRIAREALAKIGLNP